MAYDDLKSLGYRESVTIAEIDLDINDPNIDFSNDPDSYNTPKTTIDGAAYNGTVKTYIFSNQQLEFGVDSFPLLKTISSSPAVLEIGEDVALSASAAVEFSTVESNDVFQLPPPYDDRRVDGGDFWGLMYARNYFQNREARLKRGYNPLSLDDANFQIEHYVIKSTNGLNKDGLTSINFIDRLFFATESKAKAPVTTDTIVNTLLSNSTTVLNFTGNNLGDKGRSRQIVNGDVGMISIGDEIISYTITAYSGTSGSMSLVRAQGGTTASNHDIGETLQGCFITEDSGVFGAENITDINRRLFNDFTEIGTGFIDDADWDAEKAGNLSSFNFTNIIAKPTEIRKILKETIQNSGSWMYFDTITNKIVIGASARFDLPVITFTEDLNILQNSMTVTPQYGLQVTRASIKYNKLNFIESNDNKNYRNVFIKKDDIQEGDAKSGKQSEAKEIVSNWFTGSTVDVVAANSIVQLKVERFSEIPNKFIFKVDSKDIGNIPNSNRVWYGSVIEVFTRQLLNPNGSQKSSLAQITSIKPLATEDTWQVTAISYNANIPTNVDLYIDSDKEDFLLTDLLTTTEAREYVVVINSGVRITSTSTSISAFNTGVFFAGATLKIINQGFIVGAGGIGRAGAEVIFGVEEINAITGLPGGDAFNLLVDTILDNLTGLIGGGGGGGGGGGADNDHPSTNGGGGGGGGAGDNNASGGSSAFADPGESGSFNFGGNGGGTNTGGIGGKGGNLGEDGDQGGPGTGAGAVTVGAIGGITGNSIVKNGNSLDILSGDNLDQIRGPIV